MATYSADVRPGDIVRGADGGEWGVLAIGRAPRLSVTLVRGDLLVTGYPALGDQAEVLATADVPAGVEVEVAALQMLLAGFGSVDLLGETYGEGEEVVRLRGAWARRPDGRTGPGGAGPGGRH